MLFGLLFGLLIQIVIHGCIIVDGHGGSEPATSSAQHHRVIIVVPKEIKHIHHYKYIPAPKEHKPSHHHGDKNFHHNSDKNFHHHSDKNFHHHHYDKDLYHHTDKGVYHFNDKDLYHHNDKVVLSQSPPRNLHQYQPQPRGQYKSVGYETHEPQRYSNNPPAVYEPQKYTPPALPVTLYEPQFPKVSPPTRQQVQNTFVSREPKLADYIKPNSIAGPTKTLGKEANYLNYGFKTPAHVKTAPVQKQKNNGHAVPAQFDEPYKFQDPFVNAFPQLQQAFNIHSNLGTHTNKEALGSGGAYLSGNFQNYNLQQNGIPQAQSEEPFDPYTHITHHPHGLVHVNLGNNLDGQIKQIEISNNGDFQAHLENDGDSDKDDGDDASEEEGGGEEEEMGDGDDGDEGFDEFFKEDNQKELPYSEMIGHDRAISSIYPKGPMVFSHEHYDITPRHPLQQYHEQPLQQFHPEQPLQQNHLMQQLQQNHLVQPMQQHQVQQNHLVTPTPTPAALQPLQPLYHRQLLPIQHLQPPSQEEQNQFVPIPEFNYNTFKK